MRKKLTEVKHIIADHNLPFHLLNAEEDGATESACCENILNQKSSENVNLQSQQAVNDSSLDICYSVDEQGIGKLPDGTIIVEPKPSIEEETSKPSSKRARKPAAKPSPIIHRSPGVLDLVKCTRCSEKIDPFNNDICVHPQLEVILCKRCYRLHIKTENFERDSTDNKDSLCRWCIGYGDLVCCDTCSCSFCSRCIKRNLGRSALSQVQNLGEDESWKCYICQPEPLQTLRQECKNILASVASFKDKQKQRSERFNRLKSATSTTTANDKIESDKKSDSTSSTGQFGHFNTTTAANLRKSFPSSSLTNGVNNIQPNTNNNGPPPSKIQVMSQNHKNGTDANKSFLLPSTLQQAKIDAFQKYLPNISISPGVVTSATTSGVSTAKLNAPIPLIPPPPLPPASMDARRYSSVNAVPWLFDEQFINSTNVEMYVNNALRDVAAFYRDLHRIQTIIQRSNASYNPNVVLRNFRNTYHEHYLQRLARLPYRLHEENADNSAISSLPCSSAASRSTQQRTPLHFMNPPSTASRFTNRQNSSLSASSSSLYTLPAGHTFNNKSNSSAAFCNTSKFIGGQNNRFHPPPSLSSSSSLSSAALPFALNSLNVFNKMPPLNLLSTIPVIGNDNNNLSCTIDLTDDLDQDNQKSQLPDDSLLH